MDYEVILRMLEDTKLSYPKCGKSNVIRFVNDTLENLQRKIVNENRTKKEDDT